MTPPTPPTSTTERAQAITPARRLQGMTAYQPPTARWPLDLRLDANEGAPPSEQVQRAIENKGGEPFQRYPSAAPLEAALAAKFEIDPRRIVVTNGGDDAIDRLCRAMLEPGRELLIHAPTFEMIPHSARLAGASIRSIEWLAGPFPSDDFISAITEQTALVAIVSPNNPTGAQVPLSTIRAAIERARTVGAVVLLDFAYIEFADEDPTANLLEADNLVIVRTFSKARGLAGLRVGYAIANEQLADWLRTTSGPYPVSNLSLAAALESLRDDAPVTEFCGRIRQERAELTDLLAALGAEPIESRANFVTARCPDALFVKDALASMGIGVRAFGNPLLAGFLRITLPGNETDFARLTAALRTAIRPTAILFDLDGVIADVSRSYRRTIIDTAKTWDITITEADVTRAKRAGDANNDWVLTQRLLESRGVPASLSEVTHRFQQIYEGTPEAPGLEANESCIIDPDLLDRLADRARLAIVTGRPRAEAERFLKRAGLLDRFPVIVCMEDAPPKPAPDPVNLALQQLSTQSAWFVGDTVDDVRAALASRTVPIAIPAPGEDPTEATAALDSAGAVRTITDLSQLEDLLR